MIPTGTICRIVTVEDVELRPNIGRLVVTRSGVLGFTREVEALQTILGGNYGVVVECPAGAVLWGNEADLKPLGDEGPEESDLFGVPKICEKGLRDHDLTEKNLERILQEGPVK